MAIAPATSAASHADRRGPSGPPAVTRMSREVPVPHSLTTKQRPSMHLGVEHPQDPRVEHRRRLPGRGHQQRRARVVLGDHVQRDVALQDVVVGAPEPPATALGQQVDQPIAAGQHVAWPSRRRQPQSFAFPSAHKSCADSSRRLLSIVGRFADRFRGTRRTPPRNAIRHGRQPRRSRAVTVSMTVVTSRSLSARASSTTTIIATVPSTATSTAAHHQPPDPGARSSSSSRPRSTTHAAPAPIADATSSRRREAEQRPAPRDRPAAARAR